MSALLPEGIDHLGDIPFTLHFGIKAALRILKYEEYPIEERPPKDMWFDPEKLNAWWEKVEDDRRAEYGLDRNTKSDIPAPGDGPGLENGVELIKRG